MLLGNPPKETCSVSCGNITQGFFLLLLLKRELAVDLISIQMQFASWAVESIALGSSRLITAEGSASEFISFGHCAKLPQI